MSQLEISKILDTFQTHNLSQKDYLSYEQLFETITKLNGEPFDVQTFEQLWDQCKLNSKGQTKLSQFVTYVIKAEHILADKLNIAEISIAKHESIKKPKPNDFAQQQQYRIQLEELQDERQSIKLSLKIIRKPFLNPKKPHPKDKSFEKQSVPNTPKRQKIQQEQQEHLFDYDSSQTTETLTKILYWTITLLAFNCLCSFQLNRFIDMTLCGVIMLGYCLQAINRKIVRMNLYLLAFSIAYTFLWLFIYTDKLWYPGSSKEFPAKYNTFLKVCIMAIIGGQFIKILLCYYYLTISQIDEDQAFSVVVGERTLFMKNELKIQNVQKNPLIYALRDIFNKDLPPPEPELPL